MNLFLRAKISISYRIDQLMKKLAYIVAKLVGLKANKIIFVSMMGNSYGCNPKAIADYIKAHDPNFRVLWAFNEFAYSKYSAFEKNAIQIGTFRYYFHLYTSKFIVSNARVPADIMPRKLAGQIYLQTWHGTALKRIEADVEDSLGQGYLNTAKRDSTLIDYIISESAYMSDIYQTKFWYNGKVLEFGSPRNDLFFGQLEVTKQNVYRALNVPMTKKILLYAPTFRNGVAFKDLFKVYDIDLSHLLSALKSKVPGDWQLAIRFHPNLITEESVALISAKYPDCINASLYPDMQELLAASETLVTDYSSAMFDFMYLQRPCFMYTKDKATYDRGFYMPISNLPFLEINSNAEIDDVINSYDENQYKQNLTKFINRIGALADGHASERVYNFILNCGK